LFLYSPCHNHFHFNYYSNLSWTGPGGLSAGDSQKRGFCLISYYRLVNSEWSPLHNPYGFCSLQGIASGWADIYSIGLPCQWKDVTNVVSPVNGMLRAEVNFAGLLCEGVQMCASDGETPLFVETNLSTCAEHMASGNVSCSNVSTFLCDQTPGSLNNNPDSVPAFIGGCGASYVTQSDPTKPPLYTIGPLRDTEFSLIGTEQLRQCTPNAVTILQCSIQPNKQLQVLRVCESSRVLGCALACRYNDSFANVIIEARNPNKQIVTFICPGQRDAQETGGVYSLYQAMVIVTDGSPDINCVQVPDGEAIVVQDGLPLVVGGSMRLSGGLLSIALVALSLLFR